MNQAEPTPKRARSLGLWLIMLALVLVSVPLLLFALIAVYFSSRSAQIEMRERVQAAERLTAEIQARQAMTVSQNLTPAVVPPGAAEQVDSSIAQVRVDFPDFGSRTADALIIDETNGLILLTAPSSIFAPITGKMNGRMMTRQPGLIALTDGNTPISSSGFGSMMAVGAMPGMSGGAPAFSPEVAIAAQLPGLGLTLLRTHTRPMPLRIKGDFAVAAVGEALSVHQKSVATFPPTTLTVLATDQAVTDNAGQRLDHLLKLTAWQDGLGGIVCNSKGEPIGQIVLTVSEQAGSSFTYAAPLGRIFDEYYSQATDSAEGSPMRPGASLDVVRSAPRVVEEPLPPLGPDVEITGPLGEPLPERSTGSEPPPLTQAGPLTNPIPDNAPADALLPDSGGTAAELRIYKVKSSSANAVDKLRPLFSDTLQVAADTAHGTVLVLGDRATHEKVAAALKAIDELAMRQSQDPEFPQPRSNRDDSAPPIESAPPAVPALSRESVQSVTGDVRPGKSRPRGRDTKLTGPDPQEIAQLLTRLYGQQTTISVDDASGRVLVTINPAATSAEAQQVLAEIKSTAAQLAIPATSSQRTVTIFGSGLNGLSGQITLDPGQQQAPSPIRIDDQSMDNQARQLAQKYLSATPAEQPALREELTDLIKRHFNLRQAERQREIDEIGRRLERLRASHQQRQQRKSEVIERRIQDLLDANSDFWTGESRNAKKSTAPAQAASGASDMLKPATASPTPNGAPENSPTVRDSLATPGGAAIAERTFDGVPYAQWVQMLETERKASKLAMAIDACSRLVKPEDQTRIAHLIIAAAQSFEAGDYTEWTNVWDTSWEGLGRLRPEVVASELLAAIRAPESTPDARRFQGRTLAEKLSAKARESMLQQSPKIIDELVQLQQKGGPGVDWLLAGASVLWRDSGRPLDDLPNLRTQMIQMIDEGFGSASQGQIQPIRPEWQIVAETLIAKAPTIPGLALKLIKHAGKNEYVIRMIGELGRDAEPVVPLLVDDFVATWKLYERNDRLLESKPPFATANLKVPSRCIELITAIGRIGAGEKGGLLLRDLKLILPRPHKSDEFLRDTKLIGLSLSLDAALSNWTLPPNDALPLILDDQTMIVGDWRLIEGLPSAATVKLHFGQSIVQVPRSAGIGLFLTEEGQKLGDRFEIDSSVAVKQISFFDVTGPRGAAQKELPGTRRDGIYELTGTKLRFQLANPEQPRPTAFVKDRADLVPGEVLLEFEREIMDWVTGTRTLR